MDVFLIDQVQCPACYGALQWKIFDRTGDRIETADARCSSCGIVYPVQSGIGLFLTADLPRNDLWLALESGLSQALKADPRLERSLMNAPLPTLNPADQFFRAMVLEERGQVEEAQPVRHSALRGMYTAEYLGCLESQIEYLIRAMHGLEGPIVDLASGRGTLVRALAERVSNPIVMTDFSPTVLNRACKVLESVGLLDRVSPLAFDARRSPFKDGAVTCMTSFLGLPNVEQPGALLYELRRAVGGSLFAISQFYAANDEVNLSGAKNTELLTEKSTIAAFLEAGWKVALENRCRSLAEPTPQSDILPGASIDSLPLTRTYLQWSVLVAR